MYSLGCEALVKIIILGAGLNTVYLSLLISITPRPSRLLCHRLAIPVIVQVINNLRKIKKGERGSSVRCFPVYGRKEDKNGFLSSSAQGAYFKR